MFLQFVQHGGDISKNVLRISFSWDLKRRQYHDLDFDLQINVVRIKSVILKDFIYFTFRLSPFYILMNKPQLQALSVCGKYLNASWLFPHYRRLFLRSYLGLTTLLSLFHHLHQSTKFENKEEFPFQILGPEKNILEIKWKKLAHFKFWNKS